MILLCDITRSGDTLRYATDDYVDGSGNAYRGDILEWPSISRSMPDGFYGIEQGSDIDLVFSNANNGIDATWDTIIAEEELRNCQVKLSDDDGNVIFYGYISGYEIGVEATLNVTSKPAGLNSIFPRYVVDDNCAAPTALDFGATIPICFGHCKNVPMYNIQSYSPPTSINTATGANKLIDSAAAFSTSDIGRYVYNVTKGLCARATGLDAASQLALDADIFEGATGEVYGVRSFDYILPMSSRLEGIWEDATAGRGIKRNGELVSTSEYVTMDGLGGLPVQILNGYNWVKFAYEQRDFSGQPYAMTADIKGIAIDHISTVDRSTEVIFETTSCRNPARIIEFIKRNPLFGLTQPLSSTNFLESATLFNNASVFCDYAAVEQKLQRDHINELLFPFRSYLTLSTSGSWALGVDQDGTVTSRFGQNDGYWNNCKIESVSVVPTDNAIKTAYLEYDSKRIEIECSSSIGQDKTYSVSCITDDETAKWTLSYVYGRQEYSEKTISIACGSEAATVQIGEVISVTCPERSLSSASYKVVSKKQQANNYRFDCESYSSLIFSSQAITAPTTITESTNYNSIQVINTQNFSSTPQGEVGQLSVIDQSLSICVESGATGVYLPVGYNWEIFSGTSATVEYGKAYAFSNTVASVVVTIPPGLPDKYVLKYKDAGGKMKDRGISFLSTSENIRGATILSLQGADLGASYGDYMLIKTTNTAVGWA